jgi:hypothetical protein
MIEEKVLIQNFVKKKKERPEKTRLAENPRRRPDESKRGFEID